MKVVNAEKIIKYLHDKYCYKCTSIYGCAQCDIEFTVDEIINLLESESKDI